MNYYYVSSDSNVVGPMPEEAIRGLWRGGVLGDLSLVAREGSEEWRTFAETFETECRNKSKALSNPRRYGILIMACAGALICLGLIVAMSGLTIGHSANAPVPSLATPEPGEDVTKVKPLAPLPRAESPELKQSSQSEVMSSSNPSSISPGVAHHNTAPVRSEGNSPEARLDAKPSDPEDSPNLLAEWYDAGYHQGATVKKVYEAFGVTPETSKGGLFQILKSLGVEASEIRSDQRNACVEGYGHALASKPSAMEISPKQKASVLPRALRGYHLFKGELVEDDAGDFAGRARAATVIIFSLSNDSVGQGSGFFIAPGILLTNRHVVEDGERLRVRMPDRSFVAAELIRASTTADVALLRIELTNHPILKLSSSQEVKVGSNICAVGFPESFLLLESSGEFDKMEALKRLDSTSTYGRIGGRMTFDSTKCFHVDLNINHGNSGGPVVNTSGDVVGISTYGLGDRRGVQGLNYAIESDIARQFVRSVLPDLRID
ncbi:trypsin-like peptidase [Roseimicrobium gellanilyticum]|uniref:Trypsin-like peptidase n=1 Tax=Roseimicrobium gellanilyticum TaxID=748857 RepID=A0A366HFW9_9BACT|nr:trypsin-like peptidase domain-containing protein [Roseimicrobium gellanilyticum]RBP41464.1 trypsin-like peptidase [Roseimicrobium gellanilyticum]